MASSCGTCRFFSALDKECRKNPPVVLPMMTGGGRPASLGVFPPTTENKWCGAHEPTDPKETT